jgi:hypothetical protein
VSVPHWWLTPRCFDSDVCPDVDVEDPRATFLSRVPLASHSRISEPTDVPYIRIY